MALRKYFFLLDTKRLVNSALRIVFSLALGGAILYWMYRGFDFGGVKDILKNGMSWKWMLLSLPFGIFAQMLRGYRWLLTLSPIDLHPRKSTAIHSIFLSYASSLVIPRIGEFLRCWVLRRYDSISFSKALGTVVTERIIDTLLVGVIAFIAFFLQIRMFSTFFEKTGTTMESIFSGFSLTGYIVTAICALSVVALLYVLLKRLSLFDKMKSTMSGLWQGIISIISVKNLPLFIFYTLGIWVCYFIHYYLTFFSFNFTLNLGIVCAFVTFVVGSIAVIVPTPNGAGPWHFAVKTMLILYGVEDVNALYFVLIVHATQTLLVVLLGIYSLIALSLTKKKINYNLSD